MRAQSSWELIHSTSIQTHAVLNLSITTKTLSRHHTLTYHNIHTSVCNVLELQPLISHRTFLSYVSSINKLQLQKDAFNKSDWRLKYQGGCVEHIPLDHFVRGGCVQHIPLIDNFQNCIFIDVFNSIPATWIYWKCALAGLSLCFVCSLLTSLHA